MLAASEFIKLKVEALSIDENKYGGDTTRENGDMVCDLDIGRPFEGFAKAELKGLPPFSSTEQIEFDSNTSQIRFPITEEKARAGLTRICSVCSGSIFGLSGYTFGWPRWSNPTGQSSQNQKLPVPP